MAGGLFDMHEPIARFVIQLFLIISISRLLQFAMRPLKQTMVVAEVLAGILLGPSAIGRIPGFTDAVFPSDSLAGLQLVAQIGLVLFMFLIGLELDIKMLQLNFKKSVTISVAGILFPFCLGGIISVFMYYNDTSSVSLASYVVFLGLAMSITAFPVLARILTENNLTRTKLGVTALSSAAVDDVVAWCFLALVVALMRADNPYSALLTIVLASIYGAFLLVGVKKWLQMLVKKLPTEFLSSSMCMTLIFMLMFLSAFATQMVGIHSIFGAFLWGVVIPREDGLPERITEKLEDLVVSVMLPLYFTFSGLRTQLGLLSGFDALLMCLLVILAACIGKIGGSLLSAHFMGFTWRESLALGVLKNAKGLVELIVLNIGLELGIISSTVFAIMVLMALTTTFITTPLLNIVYPKKDLIIDQHAKFDDSTFSVMTCVSDRNAASKLSLLVTALVNKENLWMATRIVPMSDRPSVYMRPGNQTSLDEVFIIVTEAAAVANLKKLVLIREVSNKLNEDMCRIAQAHNPTLLLFAGNRQTLIKRNPGGRSTVKYALKRLNMTVGVLIDAGNILASSYKNILLLYCGMKYDLIALKIARKLAKKPGSSVTILELFPDYDKPRIITKPSVQSKPNRPGSYSLLDDVYEIEPDSALPASTYTSAATPCLTIPTATIPTAVQTPVTTPGQVTAEDILKAALVKRAFTLVQPPKSPDDVFVQPMQHVVDELSKGIYDLVIMGSDYPKRSMYLAKHAKKEGLPAGDVSPWPLLLQAAAVTPVPLLALFPEDTATIVDVKLTVKKH